MPGLTNSEYKTDIKKLGENEYLVQSSVGGSARFCIESKNDEKIGFFLDWAPKDKRDAGVLLSRSFFTMFYRKATSFEFPLDNINQDLFLDRLSEVQLIQKMRELGLDRNRKVSLFDAPKLGAFCAEFILETNRRPHGTPSLRTIELMKKMSAMGIDWYEFLYKEGEKFSLTEKAWQQIMTAFGTLSLEEVGMTGVDFLIGISISYNEMGDLNKLALNSIKKLLQKKEEENS